MTPYKLADNRRTIPWGILLILCALILCSSVSCATKGSSKKAVLSDSSYKEDVKSAQDSNPKKKSSSSSWTFAKKKKTEETSDSAQTDKVSYKTSDSVEIERNDQPSFNSPSTPVYSDTQNTSASVEKSSADPMAYDPNGPIEVHRLPATGADPVPETAPINPAMGNNGNQKSPAGLLPDPQANSSKPSIQIKGYVNGGATFRGQSPKEQVTRFENQRVYDVRVISDVPLSQAQSTQPSQNATPNGYASPILEEEYDATSANNVAPTQPIQNPSSPKSFTQPQGGIQSGWTPPGIKPANGGQWPEDEFVGDGGVGPLGVRMKNNSSKSSGKAAKIEGIQVHDDFSVSGLNPENTIVHYDTLDGDVGIEASNRVEIYAPKFASVRQVTSLGIQAGAYKDLAYDSTQVTVSQERTVGSMQSKQNRGSGENIAAQPGEQFISKQGLGEASNRRQLMAMDNQFQAYENFRVVKTGQLDRSETAMLAESERRAAAWNYKSQPQVIINNKLSMEAVKDEDPGILYTLQKDTHNPKVRIIKLANVEDARPGDRVEFTIRFDNIGDEAVGNVTILDSLSGRLEYAEGTAQCSVKGSFMTETNSANSLVLRWAIDDPLKPGEGGIIRFECIVR